nr:hypothetical protein [Verminephrobacter aporrectodeae]
MAVLCAASSTPARLLTLIALLAAAVFSAGVRVPVQSTPPSDAVRSDSVPLGTLRFALPKPVTASLKRMLTWAVSPILSWRSAMAMLSSTGGVVSGVLFCICRCAKLAASLPAASCMALASLPLVGSV